MLGRSDGLEEEVGLTRDQSQGGGVNSYNISTVIFQVWNENISHDKTNIAGYSKGEVSSTTRKKNAARCYSKWKKGGKEYLNLGLHPTTNNQAVSRCVHSVLYRPVYTRTAVNNQTYHHKRSTYNTQGPLQSPSVVLW